MVTFLFVILMFRSLQLLYIVYGRQRFNFHFVGKVKTTQCYIHFNAINITKQLTCETEMK